MRKRALLIAAAGFASGVVLGALLLRVFPGSVPPVSHGFWGYFHPEAVEATHYSSLDEMKGDSRVVILGNIDQLELSRQWTAVEEWGDDGIATYVRARITPDRVLKGQPHLLEDGSVGVEFFLANPKDLKAVLTSRPTEQAVFFLTPKADVDGLYRLSSSQAYLRDFGHVEPPIASEDDWLRGLKKLTFDELVAQLSE